MLYEFYRWVTYNPSNISIKSVLPQIVFLHLFLAFSICIFASLFYEFSRKTVVLSLVTSPYSLFFVLWQFYFIGEITFVQLMPAYPCIAFLLIKFAIRKYRKNKIKKDIEGAEEVLRKWKEKRQSEK